MMVTDFTQKTKDLIDNLKGTCASYGLGNDGNESKIITQVFLYKFMNDKFGYSLKKIDPRFTGKVSWEKLVVDMPDAEFNRTVLKLSPNTAKLKKEHLLSSLYNKQNSKNFSKLFDSTLIDVSQSNSGIFSVSTANNAKIVLFDELSQFVSDPSQRDDFCRAIVNQLVNFSFEEIFTQKFDFFSTIFEYLIKDYNKDGGGKYAEYYTPHAVSKIMAKILVTEKVSNVTVYDPSAGSGTLLMNVAHEVGENNCTIYSQDISQKSSGMLRLNLILNDLVHSIPNIIQGNTLQNPFFKDGKGLKKFDFIVSNPPFKLDFSDFRDQLEGKENASRFFAGIPKVPAKKKDSMPIYLLFLQHIISSLSVDGKAAIVVPTGFLTAQESLSMKIRKKMVDENILAGVVSMPSNIFATTGTNVSIVFVNKKMGKKQPVLVDASNLGTPVKDGKNQKTLLSEKEELLIIDSFISGEINEGISVVVDPDTIKDKNYSFNPGQYFELKFASIAISDAEFKDSVMILNRDLARLLNESSKLGSAIIGEMDVLLNPPKQSKKS
jgi:type I restriction enzyme M protein